MKVFLILCCTCYALISGERRSEGSQIFELCDGDVDGKVTKTELTNCANAVGADASVFPQLDSDGDGNLKKSEMASAHFQETAECGREMLIKAQGSFLLYLGSHDASITTYCDAAKYDHVSILEEYTRTCMDPVVTEYDIIVREIIENEHSAKLCDQVDVSDVAVGVAIPEAGEADSCSTIEFRKCLADYVKMVQDPREPFCVDKTNTVACLQVAKVKCGTEASALLVKAMVDLHDIFVENKVCDNLVNFV